MKAYICPNCNEELNLQEGFDPNLGDWECDNCGVILHHDYVWEGYSIPNETRNGNKRLDKDDDITEQTESDEWKCHSCGTEFLPLDGGYENRREAVGEAYFCNRCSAILNLQKDFDLSSKSWKCTGCGFENTKDHLCLDHKFGKEDFHCKNCNNLLNRQPGFAPIYGQWKCAKCGFVSVVAGRKAITENYGVTQDTNGVISSFDGNHNNQNPPKNKWIGLFLCLIGGMLGLHKFYEGKIIKGILYPLILVFVSISLVSKLFSPTVVAEDFILYLVILFCLYIGVILDFLIILFTPPARYGLKKKKNKKTYNSTISY